MIGRHTEFLRVKELSQGRASAEKCDVDCGEEIEEVRVRE